ncbi:hypothetical protein ACFYM2_01065 [Streptomyces sp. NPDC006711]|uniref:hypothetical protein n=1 Tax=Streptomyces sp. NPDC006711 TaxID=3364762 RepID=UPI0036886CE1
MTEAIVAVEGRCVRRYSSNGSDGTTRWRHVHGFTTLDGRCLEFEEDAAVPAQGDAVAASGTGPRTPRAPRAPGLGR